MEKPYVAPMTICIINATIIIKTFPFLLIKKHLSFYRFTISREVCHKQDLQFIIHDINCKIKRYFSFTFTLTIKRLVLQTCSFY